MKKAIVLLLLLCFVLTSCKTKSNDPISTSSNSSEELSASLENISSDDLEPETLSSANVSQSSSSATTGTTVTSTQKYDSYKTVDFAQYDSGDDDYSINSAIDTINMMGSVAAAKGKRIRYTLKMPKRRYELSKSITLTGVQDLTIDGEGSSFVFTNNVTAILMNGCKNIIFTNFFIDYDPLRYTQGIVTAINGVKCTVEIDKGYPSDIDFINGAGVDDVYGKVSFGEKTFTSNIYDATGAIKSNTPTMVFKTNAISKGGNLVELTAHSNSLFEGGPLDYLNVGDIISLSYSGPKLVWADYCLGGIEFININVYSAPGAGFWELGGEGGTLYKNVCVSPGSKPTGAIRDRVLAMSGDCIHSTMLKQGPTIDGCTFINLADDAVNLNGQIYYVLSSSGNQAIIAPRWDYPLLVGEKIKGYDGTSLTSSGTATITKFASRKDSSMTSLIKEMYQNTDQQWGDNTLIYEVTTNKPLNLKKGDCITSLDRHCSGAVIKNSTFGKNRSRGIVVKGDDVLIENNTITGCMFPSIVVQLDLGFGEAGFSSNVIIRGNKITNSTVGKDMTMSINRDNLGAIMVNVLLDRAHNGFINSYEQKNILIENNVINRTAVYGISCTNVDGLTIRNNSITNPFMFGVGKVGQNFGIKPNAGIFIGQSMKVSVTGNTVTGGPLEITKAVQIHSNVTSIIDNSNNTKK